VPLELELERQALMQLALRQAGIEARNPRVTQSQMRVSDLEADILSLPDFPISALQPLQILDPSSAHFGKTRYMWGVTLFTDMGSVLA
jgi:hypothetical protein